MVRIAARMADPSLWGQMVLEILTIQERPLKGIIKCLAGLHFLVAGV
jgi:hypothetical protein